MIDDTGQQLGERSNIPWVDWACKLAHSLKIWIDIFSQLDTTGLAVATGTTRRTQAQRAEIDVAIPARWMITPNTIQWFPGEERWLGQFTPRGIPLVVASRTSDSSILFFLVTANSCLQRDEALIDPLLSCQCI